jgi:CHAT domain-containing protein
MVKKLLPGSVDRVILPNPSKPDVLREVENCTVVHFACHGVAAMNPSKSGILFSDWESNPFWVSDFSGLQFRKAELAYLSICESANNLNPALANEAIHLSTALQLAGFPHVVGTLWTIGDKLSTMISEFFYGGIIANNGRAETRLTANSLHFAVRKAREATSLRLGSQVFDDPFSWAPFLHVGG